MLRGRRETQRLESLVRYLQLQGTSTDVPVRSSFRVDCRHGEHVGVSFQSGPRRIAHVFSCSGSQWARSRALDGPDLVESPWAVKRLAPENITGRVLAHLVALSLTELDDLSVETGRVGDHLDGTLRAESA